MFLKAQKRTCAAPGGRTFVALIRNKGGDILIVKTMLFYFTFDYSISVVG